MVSFSFANSIALRMDVMGWFFPTTIVRAVRTVERTIVGNMIISLNIFYSILLYNSFQENIFSPNLDSDSLFENAEILKPIGLLVLSLTRKKALSVLIKSFCFS